MIRFIEVINQTDFDSRFERTATLQFSLGEIWVNENHVVNIREAAGYRKLLQEGRLPADLDHNHDFASITTTTGGVTETHVVVGSVATVAHRLNGDQRTVLKG